MTATAHGDLIGLAVAERISEGRVSKWAGEIEDHHKITLNPIAMGNYPTARHLTRHLAEQIVGKFGDSYAVNEDVIPDKSFEAMLRETELMDDQEASRRLGSL